MKRKTFLYSFATACLLAATALIGDSFDGPNVPQNADWNRFQIITTTYQAKCKQNLLGDASAVGTIILPNTNATIGCHVRVEPELQGTLIKSDLYPIHYPSIGNHDAFDLFVKFTTPENGFLELQLDSDHIWRQTYCSPRLCENVFPLGGAQNKNGDVVLSTDGTNLILSAYDGTGGLIVNDQLAQFSTSGLKFNKSGLPASSTLYIFVANPGTSTLLDTGTADNGSGLIRVGVASQGNNGDTERCYKHSSPDPNANRMFDCLVINSSHVDLIGSTSDGTFGAGGYTRIYNLTYDTNPPVVGVNGYLVGAGGLAAETYVGKVTTDGSSNILTLTSHYHPERIITGVLSSNGLDVTQAVNAVLQQSGSSAITAPNSTSVFTMAGIAASITPLKSGKLLIIVSGFLLPGSSTAAADGISWQISDGTGTAPTSNAALTGTQIGSIEKYTAPNAPSAALDVNIPFSTQAVVTGLTVGTPYWIDLAQKAFGTVSQYKFQNVNVSVIEL